MKFSSPQVDFLFSLQIFPSNIHFTDILRLSIHDPGPSIPRSHEPDGPPSLGRRQHSPLSPDSNDTVSIFLFPSIRIPDTLFQAYTHALSCPPTVPDQHRTHPDPFHLHQHTSSRHEDRNSPSQSLPIRHNTRPHTPYATLQAATRRSTHDTTRHTRHDDKPLRSQPCK
jgi:hypothetical protein